MGKVSQIAQITQSHPAGNQMTFRPDGICVIRVICETSSKNLREICVSAESA